MATFIETTGNKEIDDLRIELTPSFWKVIILLSKIIDFEELILLVKFYLIGEKSNKIKKMVDKYPLTTQINDIYVNKMQEMEDIIALKDSAPKEHVLWASKKIDEVDKMIDDHNKSKSKAKPKGPFNKYN